MTTTEPLPKAWTLSGHQERVAALQLLPRRVRVLLAAGWARAVFPDWEARYQHDDRPRRAIEAAEGRVFGATTDAYAAAHAAHAAAYAAAYAAYDSAAYAARAGAYAARAGRTWPWLYRTYCHARGPEGLVFEPAWRTDTAVGLAKEIVKTRAFDLMPILADALQDAGCDHAGLLAHLRNDTDEMTLADWSLCHLLGLWDKEAFA